LTFADGILELIYFRYPSAEGTAQNGAFEIAHARNGVRTKWRKPLLKNIDFLHKTQLHKKYKKLIKQG
jgi:hypothetical protein